MKKRIARINENRMYFVQSMEHERFARNLSIADMAAMVGLSKSAYHRIINDNTESIPFRTVLHVHELTGLPMWQLCGMEMPDEFRYSIDYLRLTKDHRKVVDIIIQTLLEEENRYDLQKV